MQVSDRHLSSWDEVLVAAVERFLELEQILLKLRQLPRSFQCSIPDNVWYIQFRVVVLLGVHVHEEIDEGTLEPGDGAAEHREARPREAGRALHVESADLRCDLIVPL